jgi:sulfur carrier protein
MPAAGQRRGVSDEATEGRTLDVEVHGGECHTVTLRAPTYGDCIRAADLSPHEATALVDDRPVPEDAPVPADVDRVRVLRLIKGG